MLYRRYLIVLTVTIALCVTSCGSSKMATESVMQSQRTERVLDTIMEHVVVALIITVKVCLQK